MHKEGDSQTATRMTTPGNSRNTKQTERMEHWNCAKDTFTNFSLSFFPRKI